jgi:Tfp pilus assembly protein PilO
MKFGLRELVLVALLLSLPVGAWWFVFRPRNARDAEIREAIAGKQRKLQALNRATATIGDLQHEIASLQEAIRFFQSKLPSEKEIDRVLQEIWRMAEASHLATKSIRTLERSQSKRFTSTRGPHAEQPILIELEGDFLGFYTFLLALESQPRIMRIQDMTLQKTKSKSNQGKVHATFVVSIFFERNGNGT